ncbi:hypothetical protein AAULH_09738, partial [Lactobacillus helveticus MTCC 5463]
KYHPSNYYLLGDEGYLGKELHQQLNKWVMNFGHHIVKYDRS